MVRLVAVSHSLVAPRQYRFFDYVARQPGIDLAQVYPGWWGVHTRLGGWRVLNEGDINQYTFPQEALVTIEQFKPDVIYLQGEAYSNIAIQMSRLARRLGAKFVIYCWENIRRYEEPARRILRGADFVICGNREAEALVKPWNSRTIHSIQVGLDTDLFSPGEHRPQRDIIFQGRMTPEKGVEVLRKALDGQKWGVLWPEPNFGITYEDLPERYRAAKVIAAPSIDSESWREQHAGYASLEGLACGLYVATSDSYCIVDALHGCPGIYVAAQNDPNSLREGIRLLLGQYEAQGINRAGREWVVRNYGFNAVWEKQRAAIA